MRPGSILRHHARIYIAPGATLTVHAGASIGSHAIVNAALGIEIGARSRISWQCQLLDTDFHALVDEDGHTRPMARPIKIGADVLVGTRSIILKGADIGSNSVVGAGSVVAGGRAIPAGSLVTGNPAAVIAHISGWIP